MFCEEPRPAYDRVQLTSYFSGRTPDELSLVEDGFMARHGIELHLGDPAESIDRAARTVTARWADRRIQHARAGHRLVSVRPARARQGQ
ncbi:hypothetical protein SANTM175S_04252 [Streptomyces antimycoticus]